MIFVISIYDESGTITRHAQGPDMEILVMNVGDGEGWVPGYYDPNTYYIDAEGEPQTLPPKPGLWAIWNGVEWFDSRTSEQVAQDLESFKLNALQRINQAVGEIRRLYVTDIPGQEALYLMKQSEAIDWVASDNPQPEQFPLISAEIGVTGETGNEVAQIYLNLAAIYTQTIAQLETIRLGHIDMVESAETVEQVETAVDSFLQTAWNKNDRR